MPKKSLLIVGIIVIAIAGSVAYLLLSGKQEGSTGQNQTADSGNPSPAPAQPQPGQTQATGAYVDHREGIIAETAGTKLLFFHAPWCPQCRALEADIKRDGVPAGTTIIKVDYDSNQALRRQYGVTIQTSIVKVDDSGNLVKKYVAYDDPTLDAVLANLQ